MTALLAAVLSLAAFPARAGDPLAPAPLLAIKELRLPLCPVTIELDPATRRIKWLRLAFVPARYRRSCQKKKLRECRDLMIDDKHLTRPGRSSEPDKLMDILVGQDRPDLLDALAATPAVAELKGRKDAVWEASGEGVEYPYDKKRTLTARVRWRIFVNGEKLEIVEPLP